MMFFDSQPDTMGGLEEWGACVAALPNGVDLYGDCDYLIPLYPATVPPSAAAAAAAAEAARKAAAEEAAKPGWQKELEVWFEKNKTYAILGGLAVVLLVTRK